MPGPCKGLFPQFGGGGLPRVWLPTNLPFGNSCPLSLPAPGLPSAWSSAVLPASRQPSSALPPQRSSLRGSASILASLQRGSFQFPFLDFLGHWPVGQAQAPLPHGKGALGIGPLGAQQDFCFISPLSWPAQGESQLRKGLQEVQWLSRASAFQLAGAELQPRKGPGGSCSARHPIQSFRFLKNSSLMSCPGLCPAGPKERSRAWTPHSAANDADSSCLSPPAPEAPVARRGCCMAGM